MATQYDIIVIGAGAAGLNIAVFTNHIGLDTLLIDTDEANIGGDCLNTGCIPSKALIHIADQVQTARDAEQFGITTSGQVDWQTVRDYLDEKREIIREHENRNFLEDLGMDIAIGEARFSDTQEIGIDGDRYQARKIIIATGSRPRTLGIPGSEQMQVLTNEDIFELDEQPDSMVVIGGGPIGCELGQAMQRLGTDVTIAERSERILQNEQPSIAQELQDQLEDDGIDIRLESSVKKFPDSSTAVIEDTSGNETQIKVEAALLAIGREIVLPDDLDNANIQVEDGKPVLDSKLRTTNKDVLVCGDAAGSYQFTHAAEEQARTIITNLFKPYNTSMDYSSFGWVTYTDPEVATFGLQPNQLEERGIEYETVEKRLDETDRGIVTESRGKLVLFLDDTTILGGTMIAPDAGELVQELMLAREHGLDLDDLFAKTYPYPTATRINKELAMDVLEDSQLTDTTTSLLRTAYRYNPF